MDKVLNRIALVAAIFTLFLNQTLAGGHIGWLIAAQELCNYLYPRLPDNGGWISDSDPFPNAAGLEMRVGYALLFFILFKIFERGLFTRIVELMLLFASIYWWYSTRRIIGGDLDDPDKYVLLFRDTNVFSWVVLCLICLLFSLQVASITLGLRKGQKRPT